MKEIKKLLIYLLPYKKNVFLNVFFNILSVVFGLFSVAVAIPFLSIIFNNQEIITEAPEFHLSVDYVKTMFKFYLSYLTINQGPTFALLFVGIVIIFMSFFKNLFRYLAMYNLAPIRNGIPRDLRNKLYNKIIFLPLGFYSNEKKGDIMSRMNSDVQEIEWSLVSSIEMLIRDPITIIIYLFTLFYMSFNLTVFVLLLLPLGALIIGTIAKNLRKQSLSAQKTLGLLTSIIEETLSGMKIIKAFNAEKLLNQKFNETNNIFTRLMIKMYRKNYLANPLSEFLGTALMVLIMWYGATLVLGPSASLKTEELIAYLLVFYLIIGPSKSFSTAYYNIQKGLASVDRVNAILNVVDPIKENNNPIEIKNFEKEIEYRNVSFKYENELVLKNINLKIKKGQTIALVGHSGSGKTTLVDLLPRFYDVTEGELLIDGHNVKDLKLTSLRNLMGIVTQEPILFNDSFYNNIVFGLENVSFNEVVEAAKIANAHDFIIETENAYETNIGDRGNKLSGGQKQRISIARAILRNPPIMILDEATSSLDSESEKLVQEAINNLMKNRTSIIIAHRLSTIVTADLICVMQNGEIVEMGNHDELMSSDSIYKKLFLMQKI